MTPSSVLPLLQLASGCTLESCSSVQLLVEKTEICQEYSEERKYNFCFLLRMCFSRLPWKALILSCAETQRYAWLFAPFLCSFQSRKDKSPKKNLTTALHKNKQNGGGQRVWLRLPLACHRSLIQSRGSTQHLTDQAQWTGEMLQVKNCRLIPQSILAPALEKFIWLRKYGICRVSWLVLGEP